MGIIGKINAWIAHPTFDTSDADVTDWVLGLVVVLAISFLWTRVVKKILINAE